MLRIRVLLLAALALIALPAFTQTVELQQGVNGYEGTKDAHIISWDGSENQLSRNADGSNPGAGGNPQNIGGWIFIEQGDYGSEDFALYNDSKVILIEFDLTGVTGTASSAQLGLYYWYERSTGDQAVEGSGTKKTPHTLYVNRILKPWGEGTGSGNADGADTPDNSGAVTWNSTGFELWQAIGAEGPEDIAPPESEIVFDPAVGGWTWFDVTESVNIWLADPSSNNGVKISQEAYPETFLEPDLTLPDGTVVYSAGPTDSPTGFAAGAHNFVSSENNDHPDLRPILVMEGVSMSSSAVNWELFR
ncbi:MAG: hypothetical protein ACP5I1_11295 [Candidatus Hinthialibacter sp.]